jgi:hypothetical protein
MGTPRVRVYGFGPNLAVPLPLGLPPPPPYIWRGEHVGRSPMQSRGALLSSPFPCATPFSPSSSLTHVTPQRNAHVGVYSTRARRHAAGVLIQKIYFRTLCWIREPEVVVEHRTCASPRRCCQLWRLSSWKDQHDPKVSYVVRLHNPCSLA